MVFRADGRPSTSAFSLYHLLPDWEIYGVNIFEAKNLVKAEIASGRELLPRKWTKNESPSDSRLDLLLLKASLRSLDLITTLLSTPLHYELESLRTISKFLLHPPPTARFSGS